MTNTTIDPRRRKRRAVARGLVLLACLSSIVADSTTLVQGGKLPPPPPPPQQLRAAKKEHNAAQFLEAKQPQQQTQGAPKQQQQQHPPPPPRRSLENVPKAKVPPPPPKRAGTPVEILETKSFPDEAPFKSVSETIEPNRVIQRNATNDWSQKLDVRDPIRAKEPESHEQKEPTERSTMVEAMRLQDSDSYNEEEVGAYVRTDKTTTEDDMKSKQPLSQASSTNRMPPSTETWALRQQELTQKVEQSLLLPPSSSSHDPTKYYASTSAPNAAVQSTPPQRPPASNEFQQPPRGMQQGMPPQLQSPQHSSQYSRPPNHVSGPPQQYVQRPQPQSRRGSTAGSTLRSLWGRVEKGLDGLASLEEAVTGRAQQMASSVVPVSLVRQSRQLLSSSSQPERRAVDPRKPGPTNQPMAWNAAQRKVDRTPKPTSERLQPYGQKYQQAAIDAQRAQAESKPAVTSRRGPIDWNDLTAGKKMIRANGGASAPNGQNPRPPILSSSATNAVHSQLPPLPQRQAPATQNASTPPAGVQSTNTSPLGTNPYLQSRQPPPKNSADPHTRATRIPWDSASTPRPATTSAPKRPPPAPMTYDDHPTWKSRLAKLIPPVPRLPSPAKLFRFGKKSSYYSSMDAWKDDEDEEQGRQGGFFAFFRRGSKGTSTPSPSSSRSNSRDTETLAPPLASMMARCHNGKTTSLLAASDEGKCRSIGRYQATFDIVCVSFLLLGLQQMPDLRTLSLSVTLPELISTEIPLLFTVLQNSLTTWAPFLFSYAYLATATKKVFVDSKLSPLASSVGSTVQDESQYAQLYLRLAAALPMDGKLPGRVREAAMSQVSSLVSTSRLTTFVAMVLSLFVVMTVSVVRPVLVAIATGFTKFLLLEEWRSWPIAWKALAQSTKDLFHYMYLSLESLLAGGLASFLENPLRFAFHLFIFGSLLIASLLPSLENRRKILSDNDEEDEVVSSLTESAEQLSRLGASSSSRLSLLSENGSIENALERWRIAQASSIEEVPSFEISALLRRMGYTLLAAIITMAPIAVSFFFEDSYSKALSHAGLRWDSILDVSVILVSVFLLVNNAMKDVITSTENRRPVHGFIATLSKTLDEMRESKRRQADIQFMASVSPTAGLLVKDLWTSHTSQRAWAVRGANLQCKNGEILAILGDDGAGKTRMLTSISESLISPPKRSRTSNKVRGYVAISGVESSKWDQTLLKRRLGILLSDVRTVADTASLYSGWTLEEILEPVDGLRTLDTSHKLSSSEKSSIILALKITGLYSTLIPKLPSKLSTVITANEEDLRPSLLRPRCSVLAPAEWSKLILAKVLAQTIYDNDNAAGSIDKIENSLMGSVLVLDDPTALLSEVEEAKILKELRQTGAATIMTTNKWAAGRFADLIAVVKDGAIVEHGTHSELIARGPQQSLYAAKWHAMTMQ